jgi:hypothetical protein
MAHVAEATIVRFRPKPGPRLCSMGVPESFTEKIAPLPLAPTAGMRSPDIETAIQAWISSPALLRLIELFHGPKPDNENLLAYLARLDSFTEVWNSRGGQERHLASSMPLSDPQQIQVIRAARSLGLIDRIYPTGDYYDHLVILGGLLRACIVRPMWAAELANRGCSFGEISGLASFRLLTDAESRMAEDEHIPLVENEFQAMNVGLCTAFEVYAIPSVETSLISDEPNRSSSTLRYEQDGLSPLTVVAAPSSAPDVRRANTADTYAWWAERVVQLKPGARILLVTSAIYVPFQHADAIRMLASTYRCTIETIGAPTDFGGGMPPQAFTPTHYLQEIRSAIKSFHRLLEHLQTR